MVFTRVFHMIRRRNNKMEGTPLLSRQDSDFFSKKNLVHIGFWGSLLVILSVTIRNCYQFPPNFELKTFYIPALEKSFNSLKNASIVFDISLRNSAYDTKIYCDPINVTFYDGPSQSHSIANFIVPVEINLDIQGAVDFSGMVNATGFDFDDAKREILANGFKVFRVGVETSVRYDYYMFWKTKRYEYREGVDVKIGDTGAAANSGNNFVGIRALIISILWCWFFSVRTD